MKTTIKYTGVDVFAQAKNGRKFGLSVPRLLSLAITNRKNGEINNLRIIQRKLTSIRARKA